MNKILSKYPKVNNLYIGQEPSPVFEQAYLAVRKKEGRMLTDDLVLKLPDLEGKGELSIEWKKRKKSAIRLCREINKSKHNKILDLGCGNGWLSGKLSRNFENKVIGIDVNKTELQQAARIFNSENCTFILGNIFELNLPQKYFTHIILNASIQYFHDISTLINLLKSLLMEQGSIHIIDSPIYGNKMEQRMAAQRTDLYYTSLGHKAMTANYYHHLWDSIDELNPIIMYNPFVLWRKIFSYFGYQDSPFYWIKIGN